MEKFSQNTVLADQLTGADGVDFGCWEDNLAEFYELKKVSLKDLKCDDVPLSEVTYKNWLDYRGTITMFGKPWIDLAGLQTIVGLMTRIRDGKPINPIVLGLDGAVVDGLHRCVAFNSMGITEVRAYVPILD